jgi:hypothetical protein
VKEKLSVLELLSGLSCDNDVEDVNMVGVAIVRNEGLRRIYGTFSQ